MKALLLVILVFTFLAVMALFLNDFYIKRKFRKFIAKKYTLIDTLKQKLDSNAFITEEEIMSLVMQPALRPALYQLMKIYHKLHLFPSDYYTCEKGAESYLATWLEFPTELGRSPEEIELLTKIALEDDVYDYYVFKFRSSDPKWAAKLKWMIGVAGPYVPQSLPYEVPKRIFSRFNSIGTTSPEKEVTWVHENINHR
jgi:hypothetical protein